VRMHHDLSPFGPTAAGGSPLDELSVPKRVAHVLGAGLNCSESCAPKALSTGGHRPGSTPLNWPVHAEKPRRARVAHGGVRSGGRLQQRFGAEPSTRAQIATARCEHGCVWLPEQAGSMNFGEVLLIKHRPGLARREQHLLNVFRYRILERNKTRYRDRRISLATSAGSVESSG
jgi:hypothetical protein